MRILHVTDCYPPRLGGIETQIHRLATRQQAGGEDVSVVTATAKNPGEHTGTDVVDGVKVYRRLAQLPGALPIHPRPAREVMAVIDHAHAQGQPFDVAHAHFGVVGPFAQLAISALLKQKIPTVVTVHSLWGNIWPGFRLLDMLSGWSTWPVVFSAVSQVAAEPIRRAMRNQVSVLVIPNGVDVADWRMVSPVVHRQGGAGIVEIVAAQRFAARKRGLPLLQILRQVRRQVPEHQRIHATIVGDGPQRSAMEQYVRNAGMSGWVQLPGRWDQAALRDLYARSDIFVAPATLEAFGIAALEARCGGLPVVARSGTGVAEFITPDLDGVFADTDADMAAAITALVTDPLRRQTIAAHNRTMPPATTWEHTLASCRHAYEQAREMMARTIRR